MLGGLADRLPKAAELAEVVAQVNDVEAPPLIRAQGTEHKVGGDALRPEALAALVEESVHLVDFLAEEIDESGALHGWPVQLIGARKGGRGRAARHVAEGEDDHLQQPLNGSAAVGRRAATLQAPGENPAGAAEGEDEVLDEFLGGPEPVVLKGVHLAPLGRRSGETGAPGIEDLLQDGMHGMAASGRESVSWELYHHRIEAGGGSLRLGAHLLQGLVNLFGVGAVGQSAEVEAVVAASLVIEVKVTRGLSEAEDGFGVAGIGSVRFEETIVSAFPVAGLHVVVADVGVFFGALRIEGQRRGGEIGGRSLVGGGHVEALDAAGAVARFVGGRCGAGLILVGLLGVACGFFGLRFREGVRAGGFVGGTGFGCGLGLWGVRGCVGVLLLLGLVGGGLGLGFGEGVVLGGALLRLVLWLILLLLRGLVGWGGRVLLLLAGVVLRLGGEGQGKREDDSGDEGGAQHLSFILDGGNFGEG